MPQTMRNIDVQYEHRVNKLPLIQKHIGEYEEKLGGCGRILFRYSGTENKARLLVEGENSQLIEKIADDLQEIACKEIQNASFQW